MSTVEVERSNLWKYREVYKVLKTNNGNITKSEPTGEYIKKNHIKKLDFKKYCVKPLIVSNLFDVDDDYITLSIFNL